MLTAIIAKSTFFNARRTIPPYPNITPGSVRSLGRSTADIDYSVYGSKISSRIPNGTTVEVSIANGSTIAGTNAGTNASLCFFVVQDTMNIKFWPGKICPPFVLSWSAYQSEEYITSVDELSFTVTSLIYGITQYIDTMITNSATSITPTSTLSTVIESVNHHLVKQEYPPKPFKDVQALNGTMITSWGKTL